MTELDTNTLSPAEQSAFDAFAAASAILSGPPADAVAHSVAVEAARLAGRLLVWLAESPDLAELTSDMDKIPPEMMAQLLMDRLPIEGIMDSRSKVYWMTVGEWMGPDWIESHRKVGAFMARTESFK